MNDAKILDLTKRMMKVSTRSSVTIAECASAHFNCLASLAMEDAGGDKEKAARILRDSMDSLVANLRDPRLSMILAVRDGMTIGRPKA